MSFCGLILAARAAIIPPFAKGFFNVAFHLRGDFISQNVGQPVVPGIEAGPIGKDLHSPMLLNTECRFVCESQRQDCTVLIDFSRAVEAANREPSPSPSP